MPDLSSANVDTTTYTHRVLWQCANQQVTAGSDAERNQFGFWLASMVLGAMTFEAYLNYAGETLRPDVWAKERSFFRGAPYGGPLGKLNYLLDQYGLPHPDPQIRPFSSVIKLKGVRDSVAHAKLLSRRTTVEFPCGVLPPVGEQWLEADLSEEQARDLLDDLSEYLESTHAGLRQSAFGEISLVHALKGSTMTSIGSISFSPDVEAPPTRP